MPRRLPHPCGHPGCPALITDGRYCQKHAGVEAKRYDEQRGTSAERGYGAQWRKLRDMFLREHPLCECEECRRLGRVRAATDVDHIIPRSQGGTDDRANLQALAHECHSRKTAKQDGRFGRTR